MLAFPCVAFLTDICVYLLGSLELKVSGRLRQNVAHAHGWWLRSWGWLDGDRDTLPRLQLRSSNLDHAIGADYSLTVKYHAHRQLFLPGIENISHLSTCWGKLSLTEYGSVNEHS